MKDMAPTWLGRKLLDTYSLVKGKAELDAAEIFNWQCLKPIPEGCVTPKELVNDPWLKML